MSNPIPDQIALAVIADGSPRIAAPIRNNYSDIETAVNEIVAALSGGTVGQVLTAVDGSDVKWAPVLTTYRKTTAKQVVNTVAETDLLNGEITVGAGVIGATGMLEVHAWGDWKQQSGGTTVGPIFRLKLGTTVIFDTNTIVGSIVNSGATRCGWDISAKIMNADATNAQVCELDAKFVFLGPTASGVSGLAFTTGEGTWAKMGVSAAGTPFLIPGFAYNSAAVDTTLAQALQLTTVLPVANANVDVTLAGAIVKVL